MKKTLVILSIVGTFVLISDHQKLVGASSIAKRDIQRYTTKYDNIDIDRILQSKRLMQNYVNCLLDKGVCTPEGKELKTYLPDAIATECSKCSDTQKKIAGKVLGQLLQYHRKDFFDPLVAKYDPDGNFRRKYEEKDADYHEYEDED